MNTDGFVYFVKMSREERETTNNTFHIFEWFLSIVKKVLCVKY